MNTRPLTTIRSRTIPLPDEHIDTDRIIPARFLTTTASDGLGRHAFNDWRRDAQGKPRADCPLNDPRAAGAQVLVAGHNFGCGSSREHAAWALADLGIRAVIAPGIADIFRANASRNGILPIVATPGQAATLLDRPFAEIEIDLQACEVRPADAPPFTFTIDPFARRCLLHGTDPLGYLLEQLDAITSYEQRRPAQCER